MITASKLHEGNFQKGFGEECCGFKSHNKMQDDSICSLQLID